MSLTSVIRYVRALDSTATDGSGKTGLAFGDITAKYLVQGGTLTSLTTETISTLGTYQAPTSAAHIRIKELAGSDPTKGVYEVHFHNTQVATSGIKLWLFLSATGAAFQPLEMELYQPDWLGYIDNMVWVDETNGSAGTTLNVNGTLSNPANSIANAKTIADARGTTGIRLAAGTTATISTGTYSGYPIDVNGGTLIVANAASLQSGTKVYSSSTRGNVNGYFDGMSLENVRLYTIQYENVTIGACQITSTDYPYLTDCALTGDWTWSGTTNQKASLIRCYVVKPDASQQRHITISMGNGSSTGGGGLNIQGGYGDIIIENLRATQQVEHYSYGKLTIADSCTGGTVQHTSHVEPVDENGDVYAGAVTVEAISAPGTLTSAYDAAKTAATQASVDTVNNILRADYYIDKTTTPWELVAILYPTTGTGGTELFRKKLYDVDGGAITDTTTVIGQAVE